MLPEKHHEDTLARWLGGRQRVVIPGVGVADIVTRLHVIEVKRVLPYSTQPTAVARHLSQIKRYSTALDLPGYLAAPLGRMCRHNLLARVEMLADSGVGLWVLPATRGWQIVHDAQDAAFLASPCTYDRRCPERRP